MRGYDGNVKYILGVLSKDLKLLKKQSMETETAFNRIEEAVKYKYRPSSLLLAIIETKYPEKTKAIEMTFNLNRQTVNQAKKAIKF